MDDKGTTMVKARQELEDLYSGVVDDSVDLTFKDMARCRQQNGVAERKNSTNMEPIYEQTSYQNKTMHMNNNNTTTTTTKELLHCPSLDFSAAFNGLSKDSSGGGGGGAKEINDRRVSLEDELYKREQAVRAGGKRHGSGGASPLGGQLASPLEEREGRRRPGIPHTNICTLCSEYIYIYRNRCLVCGRVYCKNCVSMGMGEMCEGRKCVQCLGRRFSQRYIEKAGQTGCCWRYSTAVKQQELIWAEKGPRRSGERRYGRGSHQPVSESIVGTPTWSSVTVGTPQRSSNCPSPHNFPL